MRRKGKERKEKLTQNGIYNNNPSACSWGMFTTVLTQLPTPDV